MTKWNHISNKKPEEDQEVILIADPEYEDVDVWCGVYRGEKFYVCRFNGEPEQELQSKIICWIPLPESPFN
jgi:hypothetical protein